MASRPDRPYSARPHLESARPLHTSPPVSKVLTRSYSQSVGEARRYQSSIARAQALEDSAKSHSSPSKTPRLKQQHTQPEAAPARRRGIVSSALVTLLAVILLLFWQILVIIVLCIALHSSKQINTQIAEQGAFGAVVPVNPDWAAVLQDMRLCMNSTSRGNSRKDVLELRSADSTFVRTTMVMVPGSRRSVSSSAGGTWGVTGFNTLLLNVTSCGGDTLYACINSNRAMAYSLTRRSNSFVVLTAGSGISLTFAYQPGLVVR